MLGSEVLEKRVVVNSTFTKKDNYIFRHSTYIQFGDSDKIIGACVMCNPGSAKLENGRGFESLEDGEDVKGLGTKDETIKRIISVVEKTHGPSVEGKFHIYNLFTLRDSHMGKATKVYGKLVDNERYKHLLSKDFEDFKINIKNIPWILLGWGCERNRLLDINKKKWIDFLEKSDVKCVGVKHEKNKLYYRHPLPKIPNQRESVKSELISQINEII